MNPLSAHKQILNSLPIKINGQVLEISKNFSQKELKRQIQDSGKRMIYVCNFKAEMTETKLKTIFENIIGQVESTKITDVERLKKGNSIFGFVTFKQEKLVGQALALRQVLVKGEGQPDYFIQIKEFIAKKMVKNQKGSQRQKSNYQMNLKVYQEDKIYKHRSDEEEEEIPRRRGRRERLNPRILDTRHNEKAFPKKIRYNKVSLDAIYSRSQYLSQYLPQTREELKGCDESPDHYGFRESRQAWFQRLSSILIHSPHNIRFNRCIPNTKLTGNYGRPK